jgi:hypothetical protein
MDQNHKLARDEAVQGEPAQDQPGKNNRRINLGIAVVLLVLALTIWQLAAASHFVSAQAGNSIVSQSEKAQDPSQCPFTAQQIRSIHAEYIKEIGHSIPFTKDGPTGFEGGMSMLRYCKVR